MEGEMEGLRKGGKGENEQSQEGKGCRRSTTKKALYSSSSLNFCDIYT